MSFEECLYEINYIIDNMESSLKNKIPTYIRREIKNKMSKEPYMLIKNYDEDDFSEETKAYLSVLYTEYICSEKDKEKWDEFDNILEKLT